MPLSGSGTSSQRASYLPFSAASLSVTVAFFGLFGFSFLITLYFQLVHGYSLLSAGLHTLPFAVGVAASAPAAPILVRGLGTELVVPIGQP